MITNVDHIPVVAWIKCEAFNATDIEEIRYDRAIIARSIQKQCWKAKQFGERVDEAFENN